MRCNEFEKRWQQILDARGAVEQDDALTSHAMNCAACAHLLSAGTMIEVAFAARARNQRRTTSSVSLADQVLAAFQPDHTAIPLAEAVEVRLHRTSVRPGRWLTGIAIAASLGLALFIANREKQNQPVENPGPPIAVTQPPKTAPELVQAAPSAENMVAYQQLTVPTRLDREQLSWVGYQVADGIKPVTISVSNALQLLKRPPRKPTLTPSQPSAQPAEPDRSSFYVSSTDALV